MKLTRQQLILLAGSGAMLLAALCLPLIGAKSYRWGLFELPHKIGRLVGSSVTQTVAFVLLTLLVLAPVALAVVSTWKNRRPLTLVLLPVVVAAVLAAALLLASGPAPAIGLWAYLLFAACTAACLFLGKR